MSNRRTVAVTALVVGVLILVVAIASSRGDVFTHVQCDGSLPQWMLDAQGYAGGGCAEVLPTSDAPPDADWTLVCLGMC
jgi:hypothetical protein